MTIVFKKSFLRSKEVKQFVRKSQLDEFKRRILEHLDALEAKEKKKDGKVQKALVGQERLDKAGYPVGTVREWKGKKYMKVAPNKWKRKYEKEERGARLSVAAIKRKVNACATGDELLDIVLENRDRFKDENGHDLPIVKELMDYVSEARKKLSGGGEKGASGKAEGGKKAKDKKAAAESGKQASGEGKEEKPAVVRSPGIMKIRAKYEASPSVEGRKKTVVLPNGSKVVCHYRIVEADAPTASHDEVSFSPTEGFPTNENGKNINDRDYQHDTDAQDAVNIMGSNFDARAIGNPPIVTKDGIVVSGNNRTMSSKLAARNGNDGAYIQDLREIAEEEFGINPSDFASFKHPRLILEVDAEHEGNYTTKEFAAYNQDDKKTMNNVQKAVKIGKMMSENTIKRLAANISEYESLTDLYNDPQGCLDFVTLLIEEGIILKTDQAQYMSADGSTLNGTGRDFVETVLVGTLLTEENVRACDGAGGRSIRKKLVRAILPLIDNKGAGNECSFNKELNDAVSIAVTVSKNHKRWGNVGQYLKETVFEGEGFTEKIDPITGKLAELIHDEKELAFAAKMKELGAGLRDSDVGQFDLIFGGIRKKDDLLKELLDIKKAVAAALQRAFGNLGKSA